MEQIFVHYKIAFHTVDRLVDVDVDTNVNSTVDLETAHDLELNASVSLTSKTRSATRKISGLRDVYWPKVYI